MAKTPTKLEILQKINELITASNAQNSKYRELLEKMDSDTGVSDNDYTELVDVDPFTADQLAAFDQLINLKE